MGRRQPNASAWNVAYAYDAARRLTNVTSGACAFDYYYHATRKLQPWKLALPGGSQITNAFDSVARLTATQPRGVRGNDCGGIAKFAAGAKRQRGSQRSIPLMPGRSTSWSAVQAWPLTDGFQYAV